MKISRKISLLFFGIFLIQSKLMAQDAVLSKGLDIAEINCSNFWKSGIMGSCIGDKSFCFIDLDNDGKQEIICSAEVEFSSSFWYIMQYDSVRKEYIQTWL